MTDLSYLAETYRRAVYDNANAFRYQFWVNPVYFTAGHGRLSQANGVLPLTPDNWLCVPLKHEDKYLLPCAGGYTG